MIVFFMEHEGSARKSLPSGMGRPGGATGEQEFLEAGFSHQSENLCKNQASFSQVMVLEAIHTGCSAHPALFACRRQGPETKKPPEGGFPFSC
ncbi:hypothetical protein [Paracidovorax avenae]|uniref:hypothetical protein n=1 Tax=Paracidovorax avenae TaxID=80867 RepID=UPI001AD84A9C|nr:hypothetical protein [Paracidovorax avenae]